MPIFYTDTASFNSLSVTGSTIMSASSNATALQLLGSGSTILSISGSGGSIFSVSDVAATDSTLFSVSTGSIDIFTVDSLKNVSISGSLVVTGSITGSLFGTASFALNAGGGGGGSSFPFTGSAIISGSLIVTGSTRSTLGFTGSLQGTASFATTASFALSSAGGGGGAQFLNFSILAGSGTWSAGTTYYFGATTSGADTTANRNRGVFNKAGTIKSVTIVFRATNFVTSNNNPISLRTATGNGTLSVVASNTFNMAGQQLIVFSWTGLNISVAINDTYDFVIVPGVGFTNALVTGNIELQLT